MTPTTPQDSAERLAQTIVVQGEPPKPERLWDAAPAAVGRCFYRMNDGTQCILHDGHATHVHEPQPETPSEDYCGERLDDTHDCGNVKPCPRHPPRERHAFVGCLNRGDASLSRLHCKIADPDACHATACGKPESDPVHAPEAGHAFERKGEGACGYYLGGDPSVAWSFCNRPEAEHPTPTAPPPAVPAKEATDLCEMCEGAGTKNDSVPCGGCRGTGFQPPTPRLAGFSPSSKQEEPPRSDKQVRKL